MSARWEPGEGDVRILLAAIAAHVPIVDIAKTIGTTDRTIERYRARNPTFDALIKQAIRSRPRTRQPHGTLMKYRRDGCKCQKCLRANSEHTAQLRKARSTRVESAPHGTAGGYSNWNCRCERCSIAWRKEWHEQQERRLERCSPPTHGTRSGYQNHGCRCPACVAAYAEHVKHVNVMTARLNSETLATARNYGKIWTGPEIEYLATTRDSAAVAARKLGRSFHGVMAMRKKLAVDPRAQMMV